MSQIVRRHIYSEVWSETDAERAVRRLREQEEEIKRADFDAFMEAQRQDEAAQLRKKIRKLGHKPCA